MKFSNICPKNARNTLRVYVLAAQRISQKDIPIIVYKTVQTRGKARFGGFQNGFSSAIYHEPTELRVKIEALHSTQ